MPRLIRVKTSQFFSAARVLKRLDDATLRVLRYAGGYVRKVARNSIKRKPYDKYSSPGSPPFSHEGSLKDRLFFGLDGERSVVIGPDATFGSMQRPGVPELLEFGGTVPGRGQLIATDSGTTRDEKGRFVSGKRFVKADRPIRYAARPYMGPALEKGSEKFPDLFAGQVR